MIREIVQRVVLPNELSEFERKYLARMNRIGLLFFALHIPVFVLIGALNGTGAFSAGLWTLGVLAGPTLAYVAFENPRWISMTQGFAAMLMGGVLVHVGQGPVQIEMHFYFFALIAMLVVYANPSVILVAAVTVALHHLVLWLVLPRSVFNYDAPLWVVGVHALFVVLESVAACYIARSFFDNVIGLEKIVSTRTLELDARNQDMRVVLDHVEQALFTIDRAGEMSLERSAAMTEWFGRSDEGKFAAFLARFAPLEAEMFELAYEAVLADVLPLEVTLAQLPKRFDWNERTFSLSYTPIMSGSRVERMLIVITDRTSELARESLEAQQRELTLVFDQLMRDRAGFLEFMDEASQQLALLGMHDRMEKVDLLRVIHTLKGNCTIFGIQTVAATCHELETSLVEGDTASVQHHLTELPKRFGRVQARVKEILGHESRRRVELELDEYEATLRALLSNEPRPALVKRLRDWTLEPTARRLERISEQALRIAERLNKGPLRTVIRDHGLRLDAERWASFWSAFIHVIRNAIDHGVEHAEERAALGKLEPATLELTTHQEGDAFIIEVRDNGRGLRWGAIAERAKALELPHESKDELIEAIFTDGFSTSVAVNEHSGRGVGMSAVRAECHQRGGTVELVSSDGQGTCVRFRFPQAAMVTVRRDAA